MGIINKAVQKIREKGIRRFCVDVARIAGGYLYLDGVLAVLYCRIEDAPLTVCSSVPLAINMLKTEQSGQLRDIVSDDKTYARFLDRLSQGKEPMVGSLNGMVVCYVWITFKDEFEPFLGREVQLNNENAYIYDTFVHPDFRGKGIHTVVVQEAMRYIKSHGCKGVFSVVNKANTPSLRTFKKLGFFEFSTSRVRRIMGIWSRAECECRGVS